MNPLVEVEGFPCSGCCQRSLEVHGIGGVGLDDRSHEPPDRLLTEVGENDVCRNGVAPTVTRLEADQDMDIVAVIHDHGDIADCRAVLAVDVDVGVAVVFLKGDFHEYYSIVSDRECQPLG